MKKIFVLAFFIFLSLSMFCLSAIGQNISNDSLKIKKDSLLQEITDIDKKVQQFIQVDTIGGKAFRHMLDSLLIGLGNKDIYQLDRDKNGLLKVPKNNWEPFDVTTGFNDTVIFDPSFLPIAFDGRILPENLTFISPDSLYDNTQSQSNLHLISSDSTLMPQIQKANKVREARRFYYMNYPQDVYANALFYSKNPIVKETKIKKSSIFEDLLAADDAVSITVPTIETVSIKKSHWKKTGTHSLHISQTKISDGWYAGGNDEYSIKNYHLITLDYKKDKITFDNRIEWKLNLSKISSDDRTKKDVGLTEDFIKIYNVFGLEAFKKWSYSVNLETSTPLFKGYKINSDNVILRNFLSPLDINIGVGMRYLHEHTSKNDKYKTIKLGVDLSPLSFQYRYIKDLKVINSNTNYGLEEGKHTRQEFGSKVVGNLTWNANRYANLTSSLTFFTNYERVQVDISNRFSYALNRYFSIAVDLAFRFDDSVGLEKKRKEFGIDYLQYKENLSFGLTYNW